jgi:SWI/SNF-related matrix-associated actin-dependent regulator of chromatin subfamily A-like protein 1
MTKPFRYQIKGVNRIGDFGGRALLADEMGLGKSYQSIMYADLNVKHRPIIVICLASLKWNWQHEFAHHFKIRAEVLDGGKPPKGKPVDIPKALIINYDILRKWQKWLKRLKPRLIIIDECHKIKNPKAQRTKATKQICKGVEKVICLGGTPLENRPIELWETLKLLRPDVFKSKRKFAFNFCGPKLTPWGWEYNGATNLDELNALLKRTCMIRRLKKDVMKELPPVARHIIPLNIVKRREYNEASDDLIKWLRKLSPGKALRASRAKQFVRAGYLKRLAAELKLPAVFDWVDNFLETSKDKIILFAVHKNIISKLKDKYGKQCLVIDGDVKKKDRHLILNRFKTDKTKRILIAQLSISVGWNATAASTVAFVELDYVPALHEQGIARAHRIGQKGKCQAYFLVGRDTIEERLCRILREKMLVVTAVLDGGDIREDFSAFDQLISELRRKERLRRKAA